MQITPLSCTEYVHAAPASIFFLDQPSKQHFPKPSRQSLIPTDSEIRIIGRRLGISKGAAIVAQELARWERLYGRRPISARELARICDCSERQAFYCLAELELAGLMVVSADEYCRTNAGPARQNAKVRIIRFPDEAVRIERIKVAVARKQARAAAYQLRADQAKMNRRIADELARLAGAQMALPIGTPDFHSVNGGAISLASIYAGTCIGKKNHIDLSHVQAATAAKYGMDEAEIALLPDRHR